MNPGNGIPIVRLFGIEIRVSLAWALLVAMVTIIGVEQATLGSPDLAPVFQWAIGAGVALLFLASVIAHELGHALVGRRRGVPVTSIALGFIGGLAPLSIQAPRPADELVIALAGPMISIIAAAGMLASGLLVGTASPSLGAVGGGLIVVGVLNFILGVLSLVPAMPLDGGRVVRAIAWARTQDTDRASRLTARFGRMVGWLIIGVGVAAALANFVAEGLIALALGWMLTTGARTVERRTAMEELLRGVRVEEAMDRDVPWVGPHLTIDTFASRFEGPDAVTALPVVDGDQVVGVVGRRRLVRLGRRRFGGTRAEDVMARPPQVPLLAPSDRLWDALELLSTGGLDALAVAEHGQLLGLLTRDGASEAIRARAAQRAGGASRT